MSVALKTLGTVVGSRVVVEKKVAVNGRSIVCAFAETTEPKPSNVAANVTTDILGENSIICNILLLPKYSWKMNIIEPE